jgi:hypothetical protein
VGTGTVSALLGKQLQTVMNQHGTTFPKTRIFNNIAVRTSNLVSWVKLLFCLPGLKMIFPYIFNTMAVLKSNSKYYLKEDQKDVL